MSAIGKPGIPTREEREESDAFSRQLLHEYRTSTSTYAALAAKYCLSSQTIFRRLQMARRWVR